MNKKVLVTGGTGFIGKAVIEILSNKSYEIHAISSKKQENSKNVIFHQLDLLNFTSLAEFFAKNHFENLLHLAWYVDGDYQRNNINLDWTIATFNLLKLFKENGGKKFLAAGSMLEYDFKYGYLNEDLTPTASGSLYGECKNSIFKITKTYCEQNNIDFKWARIFNVYGPGEKKQRLMPSVIISCFKNEDVRVSDCLKFQDYLYVNDMASGIIALFESSYNGAMNICSGVPIQLRYIVNKIAELTHFKGKILWGAIPAKFDNNVVVGDNQKLLNLGWRAKIPLDDGLEETIKWWKDKI